MSWPVLGDALDVRAFDHLAPTEVLLDFEGPLVFVFQSRGLTYLAYRCAEDSDALRYVVAPTNHQIVRALKSGAKSIFDALSQPHNWIVEVAHNDTVAGVWSVRLADLPADALPRRHAMLKPGLEPFFTVRMVGDDLREGSVPASVIKRAVDGATKALRKLIEPLVERKFQGGRPEEWVRRLYDLPTQRIAYASFEISFREAELVNPQTQLLDESAFDALEVQAEEFRSVLGWATDDNSEAVPETLPLPILEAVGSLVPPLSGVVREVHLSGKVLAASKPLVLSRAAGRKVRQAIQRTRAAQEKRLVKVEGVIEEFDKGLLSFTLRGTSDGKDRACVFDDSLYDDAWSAFETGMRVELSARESPRKRILEVLAIEPTEFDPVE